MNPLQGDIIIEPNCLYVVLHYKVHVIVIKSIL